MSQDRGRGAATWAWAAIAAVGLFQVLSFADRFLLSLLAVPVARELRLDDLQLGLLQGSAFILPFVTATLVFGRLADRRGTRPLLFAGLATWTAATAWSGLVQDARGLLAVRALLAVGEAAVGPLGLALIARLAPPGRLALGTSVFAGAGPVGKGLALVGGGALLAALGVASASSAVPWRSVFLLAAALNLLLAPGLWLMLREAAPAPLKAQATAAGRAPLWGERPLELLVFGVAGCAAVLASQALAAWAPAHLHRSYGMAVSRAGLLAGLPLMIASPLGGLGAAALLDRMARGGARSPHALLLGVALGLAAAAGGVFLGGPSQAASLAGYVALVFALGGAGVAFLTGMQLLAPPGRRAEFAAWVVAVPNLVGFGVGPALAGWISDRAGGGAEALRTSLLAVIAGACVLGAAAALASLRLERRPSVRA